MDEFKYCYQYPLIKGDRHVFMDISLININELSFIGYALSTQQALLQDYIDGNIGLDALIAGVY